MDSGITIRQVFTTITLSLFFLLTYVYCDKTISDLTLNRFHVCCNQLRRLYKAIDQHWDIFTNDMEIQIMKDYSMLSRKFTKYYSSKYITMIILNIIYVRTHTHTHKITKIFISAIIHL